MLESPINIPTIPNINSKENNHPNTLGSNNCNGNIPPSLPSISSSSFGAILSPFPPVSTSIVPINTTIPSIRIPSEPIPLQQPSNTANIPISSNVSSVSHHSKEGSTSLGMISPSHSTSIPPGSGNHTTSTTNNKQTNSAGRVSTTPKAGFVRFPVPGDTTFTPKLPSTSGTTLPSTSSSSANNNKHGTITSPLRITPTLLPSIASASRTTHPSLTTPPSKETLANTHTSLTVSHSIPMNNHQTEITTTTNHQLSSTSNERNTLLDTLKIHHTRISSIDNDTSLHHDHDDDDDDNHIKEGMHIDEDHNASEQHHLSSTDNNSLFIPLHQQHNTNSISYLLPDEHTLEGSSTLTNFSSIFSRHPKPLLPKPITSTNSATTTFSEPETNTTKHGTRIHSVDNNDHDMDNSHAPYHHNTDTRSSFYLPSNTMFPDSTMINNVNLHQILDPHPNTSTLANNNVHLHLTNNHMEDSLLKFPISLPTTSTSSTFPSSFLPPALPTSSSTTSIANPSIINDTTTNLPKPILSNKFKREAKSLGIYVNPHQEELSTTILPLIMFDTANAKRECVLKRERENEPFPRFQQYSRNLFLSQQQQQAEATTNVISSLSSSANIENESEPKLDPIMKQQIQTIVADLLNTSAITKKLKQITFRMKDDISTNIHKETILIAKLPLSYSSVPVKTTELQSTTTDISNETGKPVKLDSLIPKSPTLKITTTIETTALSASTGPESTTTTLPSIIPPVSTTIPRTEIPILPPVTLPKYIILQPHKPSLSKFIQRVYGEDKSQLIISLDEIKVETLSSLIGQARNYWSIATEKMKASLTTRTKLSTPTNDNTETKSIMIEETNETDIVFLLHCAHDNNTSNTGANSTDATVASGSGSRIVAVPTLYNANNVNTPPVFQELSSNLLLLSENNYTTFQSKSRSSHHPHNSNNNNKIMNTIY